MNVGTITLERPAASPPNAVHIVHIYPRGHLRAYCGHQRSSAQRRPFRAPAPEHCVVCLEIRKAMRA